MTKTDEELIRRFLQSHEEEAKKEFALWKSVFLDSGDSLVERVRQLYESPDNTEHVCSQLKYLVYIIGVYSRSTVYSYYEDLPYLLDAQEVKKSLNRGFFSRMKSPHYKSFRKLMKHAKEADDEIVRK